MKNFEYWGAVPGMATMAQSAATELAQHAHSSGSHALTHFHQYSCKHFVRSASSAVTEFGIEFLSFRRYLRYLNQDWLCDQEPVTHCQTGYIAGTQAPI